MARIPRGAALVANKVSGAPGFWIGNVIVMAGVPAVMQAMLDEVAPKLKTGAKMLSETIRADAQGGRRRHANSARSPRRIRRRSSAAIRSSTRSGPNTNIVVRARDAQKLAAAKAAVERMLVEVRAQVAGASAHSASARAKAAAAVSPDKIFPVSWDQFHRDARALAWRLHGGGAVRGDRLHHARRAGAGGDRRARARTCA